MGGNLFEQSERLFRFLNIKARDGETGMDDEIVADGDIVDQCDRDAAANPADLGLDPLIGEECRHSRWHGQAHD